MRAARGARSIKWVGSGKASRRDKNVAEGRAAARAGVSPNSCSAPALQETDLHGSGRTTSRWSLPPPLVIVWMQRCAS